MLTYVCWLIYCFTGLLTTCSLIHMNDLLYVHTGYVWYMYQLEGSTTYQSRAKQRGFFCASIIILSMFWFSLPWLYFKWFVFFLLQFPYVLNQCSLSIKIFSSLCWKKSCFADCFLGLGIWCSICSFLNTGDDTNKKRLFFFPSSFTYFLLVWVTFALWRANCSIVGSFMVDHTTLYHCWKMTSMKWSND
jgi:hypothetical protein